MPEGVDEMREMNGRGSVEIGVREDAVVLLEASSWLRAGSVHG